MLINTDFLVRCINVPMESAFEQSAAATESFGLTCFGYDIFRAAYPSKSLKSTWISSNEFLPATRRLLRRQRTKALLSPLQQLFEADRLTFR